MSDIGPKIVTLAADKVGLKEVGGPNCGPPVELFAGGRQEPWCAHFVCWLFDAVGRPLPGAIRPSQSQHNPLARVQTMWEHLVSQGWQVSAPAPGDIVVFKTRVGSDSGPGWHVGIVSAVDGKRIQTIEGNSGDKVARRGYATGDKRILGFLRAG